MKAILLALAVLSAFASACGRSLEEDFRTPPAAARPQTWWHWMNGNVSKPGITADLEAMAAVGLGGVQIFDAGLAIPAGPVAFGSEAWFDHIAFAIAEAGRLGLEVTLANCSGWSSTGGPWVTVEDAMKVVVQTEARVHGPAAVDLELKAPEAKGTVPGFCRDIAVVAFPTPKPGAKVDDLKARTFRERKIAIEGRASAEPEMCVPLEKVRDLTTAYRNGRLVWNAPEGDWTVVRFCYRARQCSPRSASASGTGLECDKLSAAALDRSFDAYVGKVLARVGRGSALKGVLIDSYEVGGQNWTDGFERAFRSRKGYDLIPWLPALAGHVIDSPAATERFYGDFRRVIADLFAENYAGRMAERCHAAGLQFHCEAYGNGPFDDLQYGRQADVPMCEFWSIDDVHLPYPTVKPTDFLPRQTRPWGCKMIGNPKTAAAEAHVWGRPVAAAESFTAYAPDSRWTKGPFELKAANDRIYCGGVNRIVYHRYAHQPWTAPTRYPGMTMAHYGTQFERTQTWWEHGAKEWVAYQSRCQALLQRGVFVADVLFFSGETAPNAGRAGDSARFDAVREAVPKGYDYDVCEREALLALRVENGTVVVPGGVSYRVLVVPENETFSDAVRRKLDDLRQRGIRVVCPRELAATLQAVAPVADFTSDSLSFIHRRSPDADVYFVAQPNRRPIGDVLTFRSVRKEVELWDAVTGEIRAARDVVRRGETTSLCLPFDACGSLFVVFRDTATPGRLPPSVHQAEDLMELKGPWHVTFRETGAASDVAAVTFGELRDWTTEENSDVRYFSGTATYRKVEKLKGCEVEKLGNRRIVIDLGEVKNIAEVTVNGKSYPALWKPPFRLDITEALGQSPDHTIDLTVRVTNYWPNRLIGDERLSAADTEYNDEKGYPPLTAKSWPEWLLANRPSPTGRHAFSTCRLWTKDDELLPAGLLGPVKLLVKPVAVARTESASTAERRWPLKDDLREAGGDCPFRECDGSKTTNDDSFYDLVPGMSFSARLKFDRLPSTGSGVAVLSKGDVGTRGGFLLRLDSADEGNRLSFFVNFGGTPEPRVSTSGPIKSGVWYDVAAGWDGRDIWLTVNGETRRTARPGKPMGCAAPLTIGDFNGSICDLRFRSGSAETSCAADAELSAALRLFCSVRFERPPTGETQILGKDREYLLRYDRAGNRAGAQDAFCFYVYLNGSWEPRVVCPVAAETGRVYRVAASWDGLTARLQVDGHAAQQTRRGDAKPNVATKLSLPDARSSVRVESLRVDNRRYPLPELREVRSRELLPRVGAPFTLQAELANCGSAATNAVLVVRPEAGVRVTPSRVDLGDFAAGAVKPLVFAVEGATNLAFGADFTVLSGRERLMTVHRSVALMPAQDPDRSTWQPPVTPTKTHYLDAISGDDGADGLTPQTAWRSCARARGLVLGPGERLLLRRGSVFRDELVVTACGASANWAEIGAYGEGPRPTVRRSRNLSERCVHIVDPSYLVVRDLVVCDAGKGLDIACTRGGCRGILVERCLAHHIEGLYRRNSHGIPEWHDLAGAPGAGSTSGIGVAGSRFRDVTLRDCESYQCSSGFRANGGDVWLSRMYCHDNFCPNTSPHPYLTDTTRAWLVDSVFDASGWQASAGTMGIMLAYNDGLVIRGCHFLNQPDSKSHDEGGIDFEAAGANVLVDACTFRNNAGAAIEVLGLRTPQVRNVHIRGSRFDGDNVAKKLGPSEIYVWGGTTDRRVVCSNGLVEDNGFVLRPGISFYTNCAAATRADWTLRGNRAFASRDELNRAMPLNDPPAVEAGEEIWTDARTVTLRGRATDDGLPRNRLTTTWEQLEGPGLVRFADAATTNAAATFPHAGDYRLLLKADDGQLWRSGRTAVHVLPTGSRVAKAWTFARNLDAEGWQALGLGTTKEHLRAEDTFWDSFAEPVNLVGGDYYTFALKNASAAELVSADGLNLELKPGVVDTFVVKMNNHTSAARMKLIAELDASTEARTFAVTPNDTADRVTAVPLPSTGTVRRLRLVFADDGRPVTGTCRVDYIWVGSLGSERRVSLAVNEDNDHYFHLERDRMTREALRDYVDQYAAGGKVSHIFWTTCGQPANYDSQVWEPVWKRLEDPAYMKWVKGNERALRWPENCKFLWEKGIDPYVVWIDRCRERGISPWISMRMNDVHFSTHARMQVCRSVKYWRDHPELGRHPEWDRFDPNHREWKYFAFDYTRPEVRAYSLAMAKEQLERFRPDGLELDWMRYVCHLPAGRERELAPVLTAFMRDVRALADDVGRRAGRRIRLGVRLPTRYAYARDLGYDAETWAYEGLCDLFVVGNKDSVDYGCDVADWKRRLAPAEVIPGMDRVDCTHTERVYADYAGYRGWADAAAARGAEGYYLFNAIYLPPEVQDELWRNGLDASAVRRGPRRYVATYPDSAPDDIPEPSLCQLPRPLTQKIDLEIFAGHGRVEKSVDVVLAFDRPLEATAVRMTLNGVASEGSPVEERDFGKRYGDPKFAKIAHRWTFPRAALKPDRNRLEILPLSDSAATVRWAEVAVDLNRP